MTADTTGEHGVLGTVRSRRAVRGVLLTERDRRLLHAAWSLGAAPTTTLHALIAPTIRAGTLRDRLRRLVQHHYLRQQPFLAPSGPLSLYSLGPAALQPGDPRPWRPSLAQLDHTLAVGSTLVALTRPDLCPAMTVTGWKGEAELRGWALPGAPYPDAQLDWTSHSRPGRFYVEVDRSTESRAAWRRKLVRYLHTTDSGIVLAVTRSQARATHLAQVAADLGVPCLSLPLVDLQLQSDPVVLDSRHRRRHRLSQALAGTDP